MLLASVGLYGVLASLVAQRTQEIGIRMALGAQKSDVLRLVLREGSRMVLLGIAIGLAAGLALSRYLASLFFGITPANAITYLEVGLIMFAIALAGLRSAGLARAARQSDGGAALRVVIEPTRVVLLNNREVARGRYVLYWMQQSQRAVCNHALEYAVARSNEYKQPLLVCFGLTDGYPEANLRHYTFMLRRSARCRARAAESAGSDLCCNAAILRTSRSSLGGTRR